MPHVYSYPPDHLDCLPGTDDGVDLQDLHLNFNPERPQERFRAAGFKAALIPEAAARLPAAVPWPNGKAPQATPLAMPPAEADDLSRFRGYDAVVVTWTAAEAAALAALFTPGFRTLDWYEYRHHLSAYLPLITGRRAPFNDARTEMARSYHSLGLYFPCQIGPAKVLVFKSGLHLQCDGPATPVRLLMDEIASAVRPKVFITTGAGAAIGPEVAPGDVIIGGLTRFCCTAQFKKEPWKFASYPTSTVPARALAAITPALTTINAAKVPHARPVPKIWSLPTDEVVTTDFVGCDDTTNRHELRGLGRVCDTSDAMVGQALQTYPSLKWFAIRSACIPQMANPYQDIAAVDQAAAVMYARYGAVTTAASAIACWAVIDAIANP